MRPEYLHPSDEELLLELDGEAAPETAAQVRSHLAACWECRVRRQDMEAAINAFTRVHSRELSPNIPPLYGPLALLKAQMSGARADPTPWRSRPWIYIRQHALGLAASICLAVTSLLFAGVFLHRTANAAIVSVPDARLTPGAMVLADRYRICQLENVKNKRVSDTLQRRVFEEYGIRGADPKSYEVDYLVTPALGGADDIRNLWPHSYAAAWNAKVKDKLEDRLRDMVCSGDLSLVEAQKAIATDWIAAYKKYFATDRPLSGR